MKRTLLLLSVLLLHLPLSSQDRQDGYKWNQRENRKMREEAFWKEWPYRFEVRLGLGGFPMSDDINFIDVGENIYGPGWDRPDGLEGLYAPYHGDVYMTGQIFAEFTWHIKRSFALVGGLYANGIYSSIIDPADASMIKRSSGVSVTLLPEARFYWANYPKCRLYTSVGLGINAGTYAGESVVAPAFLFTPIGITAGRKVFFFADYAVGTLCMGGRLGIGYRF